MKYRHLIVLALVIMLVSACSIGKKEKATDTPVPPTSTLEATPTQVVVVITATDDPAATVTPTITATATATVTPTKTVTAAPTQTRIPPPATRASTIPTGGSSVTLPPVINFFSTSSENVRADLLSKRVILLPVIWDVANRPANTNLVFEQVMPNGEVRNVELPREVILVPSTGSGSVQPYLPDGASQISLRMRLININTQATLLTAQITLPIVQPQMFVQTGEACFSTNYAPNYQDIEVGEFWKVAPAAFGLSLYTTNSGTVISDTLDVAEGVEIIGGPACYIIEGDPQGYRRWQVKLSDNSTGWVEEYVYGYGDDVVENLLPGYQVVTFDVQPRTVKNGDPITITWQVEGANELYPGWCHSRARFACEGLPGFTGPQPASGSITVNAPEYVRSVSISLSILPGPEAITVTIDCRDPWFANPADYLMCAKAPAASVSAAYQAFERGFMIWQNGTIWVFVNGGTGHEFADTWDGGELDYSAVGTPPEGRFAPERGFGHVWLSDSYWRNQLGWAVAGEQGYTATLQMTLPGGGTGLPIHTYITLPDGRVMPFYVALRSIRWENPS